MTDRKNVESQLKKLGINIKSWGAAEINELPAILMPQEEIKCLIQGWYENGFATLVATGDRILLIDKKLLHLTIEDIRYDMVAEVDFNARIVDASVRINTVNKTLRFTSMRARRLRELTNYVQQRVMELRQQQFSWQQFDHAQTASGPLQTLQQTFMPNNQKPATAATVGMPLISPQMTTMRTMTPQNHFSKMSLTTKHNFLPKVPRRFRPGSS